MSVKLRLVNRLDKKKLKIYSIVCQKNRDSMRIPPMSRTIYLTSAKKSLGRAKVLYPLGSYSKSVIQYN
jgi:hypothetical protein